MSTLTTIQATDIVANSRADINANFTALNTDKAETLSDLGVTATTTELNYVDGVTSAIQTQLDSKATFITGELRPFALSTSPSGWLICAGQAVSRTTYATLFSAIGTDFGVGDGSTTFNLPDIRGRVIGGLDNQGGTSADRVTDSEADSLGGDFGSETHTLTVDEMPSHTHTAENIRIAGTAGGGGSSNSNSGNRVTTATGGGGTHNNVQPTIFMLWCIKT